MFSVRLVKIVHALGLLYYPNGEAKNTYFLPRHRGSIEGLVLIAILTLCDWVLIQILKLGNIDTQTV